MNSARRLRSAPQVAELKRRPGRELRIHGGARLAQSLRRPGRSTRSARRPTYRRRHLAP
ncbi:hypothetical protein [Streptomyces collinus]|uniref:hypothetical protein n=1 Tax=Streptomyces collinus TaxID=42684 RepID=UPI0037D19D8A